MTPMPLSTPDPIGSMKLILAAVDAGADHFAILQLLPNSKPVEARDQYFRLAKVVHPDLPQFASNPALRSDATRAFQAITAAHAVLTHPQRRAEYLAARAAATTTNDEASAAEPAGGAEKPATPEVALIYLHRGRQLMVRRDWAGAQEALELAAPVLKPHERGECHVLLGWAIFNNPANPEASRIARSKELWLEVAKLAPNSQHHAQSLYYLATWSKLHGEMRHAASYLDRCLTLDPRHIDAAREKRLMDKRKDSSNGPSLPESRASRSSNRRPSATMPLSAELTAKKVKLEHKPTFLERLFGKSGKS